MSETTIAAANVAVVHDKRANLRRFAELAEEAAGHGVELLVLPELALQGYADLGFPADARPAGEQKQYYFREAEPVPGPSTEELAGLCARLGLYMQVGLAERALHGNVIYNSAALVGPGRVLGVYRKLHNQFEYPYFMPGSDAPVVDLPFARVASAICYDSCFPELARLQGLAGADLQAVSTAWPMIGRDPEDDAQGRGMDMAVQATAFFNQLWVVNANHCEKGAYSAGVDYYGHSKIVDPFGTVVAEAGVDEGLVMHTADLREEVLRARTVGLFGKNFLQDRRPELYGGLVAGAEPTAALDVEAPPPAER